LTKEFNFLMKSEYYQLGEKAEPVLNNRNWHVVYTAPRAEKQVALSLSKASIEYYLPLRNEFHKWSDRVKKVSVPAFPSYIFVHVDQKEYYSAISVSGMVRYIKFGGVAVKLSQDTIDQIKRVIELDCSAVLCGDLPCPGTKYKISSGPLKGIEGKVIRVKGKTHFYLELKELGKYVMLPYSYLIN
jgi:transcription termination/antitermination protein NusG